MDRLLHHSTHGWLKTSVSHIWGRLLLSLLLLKVLKMNKSPNGVMWQVVMKKRKDAKIITIAYKTHGQASSLPLVDHILLSHCKLREQCVTAGVRCAFSQSGFSTIGSWPCFCASMLQSLQQRYLRGDLAHAVCRLNPPPKPVISGSQLLISPWFTGNKAFLVLSEWRATKVCLFWGIYLGTKLWRTNSIVLFC